MIYKEDNPKSKIIFHGSKNIIDGEISPNYGRRNNDFGSGFYCCESIEQTTSFVSKFSDLSVYILRFDDENLKCECFDVDQEWMIAVHILEAD